MPLRLVNGDVTNHGTEIGQWLRALSKLNKELGRAFFFLIEAQNAIPITQKLKAELTFW